MNIKQIIQHTTRPELYQKGTSVMWTDEHISKQLLDIHLNTEVDLASRKMKTIKNTVEWILSQCKGENLRILDLGCGPGLYTEMLAKKGHRVTGVDFSQNSIAYAQKQAQQKGLDIQYIHSNYLELELEENQFDLIIMIFTDFGVLLPEERGQLLTRVKKFLQAGGIFIFDVLNDKNLESKVSPKSWEIAERGFWKNKPYLALSESFLYKENKVVLNQHIMLDEEENTDIYRFWIHFFSHNDLEKILQKYDFQNICFYEDVLPEDSIWSGEHVTFCKATKA